MHIHSIHSDGVNTLDEIIERAKARNIDVIAITDHDNVDVINDLSIESEVKVIVGTEYSTIYNGENVHLLGYYKKNKPNKNIIDRLKKLENDRVNRANEMLALLDKYYGFKLDFNELINISDGSIGRPKIAELLSKYYNISYDESFNKYIGNDSPCYIPSSKQRLEDVIDFLHNNDAICVLAHPIHYKKTKIEEFINLGIDGIECYYPEHGNRYRKKLSNIAKENNLIITGGSDYHDGWQHKNREHGYIGDAYVDEENINKLLERLEVK